MVLLQAIHIRAEMKIATRKAYGQALAKLGHASDRIIALDGDTKNSTFSDIFKKEHPDRFIECYIAEQNMVSIAVGCATRNRTVPFCSTFAAFFTRAFDQIRMAAISESNINLCGSHCGVSIGEDGPSQMALEDLAMFRSIPMSTVFYPSDGVATEKAVELAANTKGICFIRTSRPENAIIYSNNEDFQVGQAKVVLKSKDDQVTVIGAGVTLHEALAAAELLKKEKISIRVLDPFTIKPLDRKLILECARATKGRILTVEDHYYEGQGLGSGCSCLSSLLGHSHPTSCCSAAEIMAVLFFHTMRYKALDPRNPHNDRFVLSKGHAAPILYAVWAEAGFLPETELLNLRKISSDLDGHPVPKQAFTDVATGSLGQGLGAACGMAYTGKYFDKAR
ncbi:transketolase [Cricetulus griseus]